MFFDCEFEITVKTNAGRTLTEKIRRRFDLPYYTEDMHPDGLGYYMTFVDDYEEEKAINNYIEYAEISDIEDDFLDVLEEDEEIIEIIG